MSNPLDLTDRKNYLKMEKQRIRNGIQTIKHEQYIKIHEQNHRLIKWVNEQESMEFGIIKCEVCGYV